MVRRVNAARFTVTSNLISKNDRKRVTVVCCFQKSGNQGPGFAQRFYSAVMEAAFDLLQQASRLGATTDAFGADANNC